jgi:predicted acylesterase/phospholipase RssA
MADPPTDTLLTGRTALCLCPGGITGAMYEVGVLAALEDSFLGFDCGKFDIYVGTSAGAFVAWTMAAGLRPKRIFQAVYRVNPLHLLGISRDFISITATHLLQAMRRRKISFAEYATDLEDALPAGIFSLEHYERFLEHFMDRHGLPKRFSDIAPELYITANDLDSGHRAVFGQGRLRDVPIAKAICASSAIAVFFEPMRIDGRDYIDGASGKTAHIDLALARGADFIIVINPLVPIKNDPDREGLPTAIGGAVRLREKGLITVWDQAGRMSSKTKLHQGIRRHQAQHPRASILLIEPKEEEADMFLSNPMNFAARRRIIRYGYESAARLLKERRAEFEAALARHGIGSNLGRAPKTPQELTG